MDKQLTLQEIIELRKWAMQLAYLEVGEITNYVQIEHNANFIYNYVINKEETSDV